MLSYRRLLRLPAALAAFILFTACGSDDGESAASARPSSSAGTTTEPSARAAVDELRMVIAFPVETIDPVLGFPGYVGGFGETLMRSNAKAEAIPLLAESVRHVDPTTWEVELRDGVRFQNGKPADAAAVVASMQRQYTERESVAKEVPGLTMTAVDTDTVRLTTAKPSPRLDYALADSRLFPIYDAGAVAVAADPAGGWAGLGAFTGAYNLSSLDQQSIVLTRHDGYWGQKAPLQKITLRFVKDAGARLAAVQRGEADVAGEMQVPEIIRALGNGKDKAKLALSTVPIDANRLHLNTAQGVLTDERVRKALLLAIDYDEIATEFLEGSQEAGKAFLPQGLPYSVDTQRTDAAEAARLLEEAGWVPGSDGIRTKDGKKLTVRQLLYSERPEFEPMSIGMQGMLKRIGVGMEIVSQTFDAKMYDDLSRWDTALYTDYAISSSGAPDSYINIYLRPGGEINFGKVDDDTLTGLLDDLAAADGEERLALLRDIQNRVAEKAYYATVAFKHDGAVVGPAFSGYVPSYDTYGVLHVNESARPN